MTNAQRNEAPIRAAGTVLWRKTATSVIEIALVHRPRYDDWSLPKGKLRDQETIPGCAVRETLEETGFAAILGHRLGESNYQAHNGQPKTVDYFAAAAQSGSFQPNDEVNEIRWVEIAPAKRLCTHDRDRLIIDSFADMPATTNTLLLIRHAKAGDSTNWEQADALRPLSTAGWKQATALRALAPLFGVTRVHAASRVRCAQTVEGIAEDLGVSIQDEPLLTEKSYQRDPVATLNRLLCLANESGVAAVCSQGGVIPGLIGQLSRSGAAQLGYIAADKGSVWVLSFNEGKLIAADYLPSALPISPQTH